MSLGPAHTQGEGMTQGHKNQEVGSPGPSWMLHTQGVTRVML